LKNTQRLEKSSYQCQTADCSYGGHIDGREIKDAVLRIRDVYPGSQILIFTHPGTRIPDLGSRIQKQQQKRGVKKIVVIPFFVAKNFTKLKIILFLNAEEKNFGQFS
jgi:hypothetical protein